MIITSIRSSALFRRIRRSHLVHEYIRPIYSRRLIQVWWAEGRPVPPPHDVKLVSILYLADRIGAKVLIETGSYLGDTVRALRGRFDLIASIEIALTFAEPLRQEFKSDSSVRIISGDSGKELAHLLEQVKKPTVFWLDAHYSGGSTVGVGNVPIYAELDAIQRLAHPMHAILIDDLVDFNGINGYPTAEALIDRLITAGYSIATFNNMIHALPGKP